MRWLELRQRGRLNKRYFHCTISYGLAPSARIFGSRVLDYCKERKPTQVRGITRPHAKSPPRAAIPAVLRFQRIRYRHLSDPRRHPFHQSRHASPFYKIPPHPHS
jgi:hypothetical protein